MLKKEKKKKKKKTDFFLFLSFKCVLSLSVQAEIKGNIYAITR